MNALLLIGSPKPKASASRSFGEAVLGRLAARGASTRTDHAVPAYDSPEAMAALLADVAWADLVVLSFPLYVDSLPAPVIRVLEAWADRRADVPPPEAGRRRLAVLTQCGFPEARHCDEAIAVCRQFCLEADVEWAGALAFGMGGAIENRPVEQSPLARALPAFEAAADALLAGHPIPPDASAAVGRQLVPSWTYPIFGGLAWWWQSRRRRASEPLRFRRYPQ